MSRAEGCVSMVSPLRVRCPEADPRATRRRLLGCPAEPQPSHPLGGPRPREAALQELETHSHWVDFSDPANEARRAMGFVKRGIERGAKVIALLPSPDIEAYRRELVESECGEDLDSGRVSLESVDDRLEMLKTAGVLAVLLLSIQGLIQVARGQGYPEVWLVGKIASSLFASAPQYPALTLRIEAALDSLTRTLPLSLYCPMPDHFPGEPGLMPMFLSGHGWASILDTALGPPPSCRRSVPRLM